MAIARCKLHGKPKGNKVKDPYIVQKKPIGYPNTACICGRKDCIKAGLVWLTEIENQNYSLGQRVFNLNTNTIKVLLE